jgi:hypothetical protein
MKYLVQVLILLIGTTPAAAVEAWVCTFPGLISPMSVRERMEVRTKEVIRDGETAYRIIENNERAVVAVFARTQSPESPVTIGTLGIDKPTGDFMISVMVSRSPLASKVVTGKCEKAD